jgi:hypothetical protein
MTRRENGERQSDRRGDGRGDHDQQDMLGVSVASSDWWVSQKRTTAVMPIRPGGRPAEDGRDRTDQRARRHPQTAATSCGVPCQIS